MTTTNGNEKFIKVTPIISWAEIWQSCTDSRWLLWLLKWVPPTDSELRLFACWCARQAWGLSGHVINEDMVEMELKGIPRTLAKHDLKFEDLGLAGCTIFYRRRVEDMPVTEIPEGATPQRAEKARKARDKLLNKAMEKYCFRFVPLSAPDGLIAIEHLADFRDMAVEPIKLFVDIQFL